jgi:hypothetical protein
MTIALAAMVMLIVAGLTERIVSSFRVSCSGLPPLTGHA